MSSTSDLIQEAIRQANRGLEATLASGDAQALGAMYTEDAQLLPTGSEPIVGQSAITEFWSGILSLGMKRLALETLEIDAQGATAIELGRYNLFDNGDTLMDRGKYIVIWKLIKGEWKLHRDIWNSSLPTQSYEHV